MPPHHGRCRHSQGGAQTETSSQNVSRGLPNSSHCRLCQDPVESLTHVLTQCQSTSEPRARIISELGNLLEETDIDNLPSKVIHSGNFANLLSTPRTLTQFLLDCTSFNLPDEYRYNINDVKVNKIFKLTRDLCFSIHTLRIKSLKELVNANKWKVTWLYIAYLASMMLHDLCSRNKCLTLLLVNSIIDTIPLSWYV